MNLLRHWYRPRVSPLTMCLLPLSWVFRAVVGVRRTLYRRGVKRSYGFSVPVIVVGNITVGGTGKTPFVIWLAAELQKAGYTPGIVSRGYGGRVTRTPVRVTPAAEPADVGDEAVLLARRTDCPLVVCADRVAAVEKLVASTACDIIISDDGLQHYRLQRQVEIAMIDGIRRFGNGRMLPAGPLREPLSRLAQVDFKVTQCYPLVGEFSLYLQGERLCHVTNQLAAQSLAALRGQTVHAVAAIGHPERFFQTLRDAGVVVIEHAFPDHYLYRRDDLVFSDNLAIVMTEKDAVKCRAFANTNCWYLPVEAAVDGALLQPLLEKIGELKCV